MPSFALSALLDLLSSFQCAEQHLLDEHLENLHSGFEGDSHG